MLKKIFHRLAKSFFQTAVFFLALLIFLTSAFLSETYASEQIGTHLGEGDISFQATIIRTVLIPNGLEAGSPITIMVGVNNLQESQKDSLIELAETVRIGNFFPIVRINDVCGQFEGGLTAVSAVQTAKEIFGNDALIVWGNEVNNKEAECSDWFKYVRDFKQIQNAGLSNVSPAALDYYMGKSEYSVSEFMKTLVVVNGQTVTAEDIFNSAPRVANAYGCVNLKESSCASPDWGGNTETRGFDSAKSKGTFYLTEFSLSPEGRVVDAPDTSLAKVIQFINERASQTGANKITPLIRNTCNDESEWLVYVNGRVFTPLGTEVTENCSGKAGAGGYDLSKYPNYGIDPNLFFLTPLRYTDPNNDKLGNDPKKQVDYLRRELAMQGYQAYCASDNIKIKAEFNTEDLVNKFLKNNPLGLVNGTPTELRTESVSSISLKNAAYPLWRDTSDKKYLTSSLEEYFGFKDVYIKEPTLAEINSAPINSLLSEKQMCIQGWKNVVAQANSCMRLDETQQPNCALDLIKVPDTDYTMKSLQEDLYKFEPNYLSGKELDGCEELFSAETELTPEMEKLKKGLINAPTYWETAYRYGFIVAAIETKAPTKNNSGVISKIFNFFTKSTETGEPKHEVLIAAFKLPDVGTNKGGGDDTGHEFFNDSLDLTRKVLSPAANNWQHENFDRHKEKDELLVAANQAAKQNKDNRIYCYEGDYGEGTGTKTCQVPLSKAITDIINANADGCGEAEDVRSITTAAGLGDVTDETGKVFDESNGRKVLMNLFADDDTHMTTGEYDPQVAETDAPADKLESLFKIDKNTWDNKELETNVTYYIVYPVGFELKEIEETIQGAFFNSDQIAKMESDPTIKHGFKFNGVNLSFKGGSDGWNFKEDTGEESDKLCEDSETGELVYCDKGITVDIKQEGKAGAGILGGKLGYIMRNAQVALSSRASDAYAYFSSCKTTEEFLLGKCRGGIKSEPTSESSLIAVAQCEEGSARITSGETAQHVEHQNPSGSCLNKSTKTFVSSMHDIPNWKDPNDPVKSCEDLFSYVACTYSNSLIQNPVSDDGQFDSEGKITACQYVVNKAKESGISPRFALAMWGEESGFSHFRVADFGVISKPSQDLEAQVSTFVSTANSYQEYLRFLEAYSGEDRGSNQFCNNEFFPARMKTYYDHLGP